MCKPAQPLPRELPQSVLNLLAVIHKDGGHHTAEVGFSQSAKDAQDKYYTALKRIAELEAKIKDLRAINEQHRILNGQLRESLQGEIDARTSHNQ